MDVLTQTIDNVTGKVLCQTLHRNGRTRVLFCVPEMEYIRCHSMRSHDTVKRVNRRKYSVWVYSTFLWIAN